MVAFETFNATLWSIVMAINKFEGESCSIQLVRSYRNNATSKFLDISIQMTNELSIPIINVDFTRETADEIGSYSVKKHSYQLRHM